MLFYAGGVFALVVLTVGTASVVQAKNTGQRWFEPVVEMGVKLRDWFLDTPEREALRLQRELWRVEDEDFKAEKKATEATPILRKELLQRRQAQLTARAQEVVRLRGYKAGSMVAFVICLLVLLPIQAASYYLKVQTARAFLVGSRNMMSLKLNILGMPLKLHTVEVVTVGLMLLEVVSGVVLSQAHERLRQVEKGEIQESADRYVWQARIAWVLIVILVATEAGMGIWRGSMESRGSIFGMVIMFALSVTMPVMTILVSYVLKTQISHVAGPLGFAVRVICFLVVAVVLGPPAVVAWLILVAASLFLQGNSAPQEVAPRPPGQVTPVRRPPVRLGEPPDPVDPDAR